MSNESALSTQVGGGHYKNLKIQPVEYIHANGMGYIEGAIVKYISRYKNKNGKEDLLKIKHFVDLLIELEYKESTKVEVKTDEMLDDVVVDKMADLIINQPHIDLSSRPYRMIDDKRLSSKESYQEIKQEFNDQMQIFKG